MSRAHTNVFGKLTVVILLLTLLCSTHNLNAGIPPTRKAVREKYPAEYQAAKKFCFSILPKTDSIARHFGLNPLFLLPIVFPECMRYSEIRNRFETGSLEYIYSKFGREYADFSVGRFQMKPSFIEELEKEVLSDTVAFSDFKFIINTGSNDVQNRVIRTMRLKSLDWQIIYLCCFYKIAEKRFSKVVFDAESDRICFYATAYNSGFWKSIDEITRWQKISVFPGGPLGSSENFPYGVVVREFFENEIIHKP